MAYEIIEDDGYVGQFSFPVVRRVFPSLIANNIISIQPMSTPSGAVFYLDYVYGDRIKKIKEALEAAMKDGSMRETIVKLIRKYDAEDIKSVIIKEYPAYRDILDKLLVLK